MGSRAFDLLSSGQKNDIFRVTFDFYTPRAHFILVPKSSLRIKPEHLHLHLIEAAKSMLSVYGISNGILSIHRGSWKSKNKTSASHFHLCVDVEKFLSVFEEKKSEIPDWPGKQYVTKQWKASRNPSSFAVNVRGYPYSSYVKEEAAAINALFEPAQSTNKNERVRKVSSGMDVVYHPSQPKIGFLGKRANSTEYLQQVFGVLEEYAKDHGLTNSDSSNDDEGCHLCLYLGDPETSDWNITQDTSTVDVMGYIVTTGTRFYQLCPLEHRNSWFQAFKLSNFKCKT